MSNSNRKFLKCGVALAIILWMLVVAALWTFVEMRILPRLPKADTTKALSLDASGSLDLDPLPERPARLPLIHRQDVFAYPLILGTSKDGVKVVAELMVQMRSRGTAAQFASSGAQMDGVDWNGTINVVANGISHLTAQELKELTTAMLYDHLLDPAWKESSEALREAGVWENIWVYTIQVKAIICLPDDIRIIRTNEQPGKLKIEDLKFEVH